MTGVILLATAVGLLIGFVIGRMRGGGGTPALPPEALDAEIAKLPGDVRGRVDALLREGQVIAAIKEMRAARGLGLRDAKAVVDRLRAQS